MSKPRTRNLLIFGVLILVISTLNAHTQTRTTLDQKPKPDSSELVRGLARYHGQSDFITKNYNNQQFPFSQLARSPVPASGVTSRRDVHDSDIFNIGPKGSKTLLLLNNYRGLMSLDFSKGPDHPQILGRVPATGNYPQAMYVDWKRNRALVVENWDRSDYGSGSRLLIYDIANLSQPKVLKTIDTECHVADTRLVGDILYIVGLGRTSSYHYSQEAESSYVKAYRIGESIDLIDQKNLKHTITHRENMGIQEVQDKNGQFQYYITAITRNHNEPNWWARRSNVEVLDISSPYGEIRPLLTAEVRGEILKRSWVTIRDNTLFVTSNYRVSDSSNSPLRVAVESFALPDQHSSSITESEFRFRQLSIERQIQKSSKQPEKVFEELGTSGELQLRQIFIQNKHGYLHKPYSDFEPLEFGDSNNQSAYIQDVRYVAGQDGRVRLHVFWVPANEIDPFDIVDITDAKQRPVYQSRLQFEGMISYTHNLEYNGRQFILGLGYITPTVDNPRSERFAQAQLLEVYERRGKWQARTLDQIVLPRVRWSDFDTHDKFVSLRLVDSDRSRGTLLFKGLNWTGKEYETGGQIVEFDLAKADQGALSEGAFIQGDEGWLRRVFQHDGLNVMMTFSDFELAVFGNNASSSQMIKDAAARVELARDIAGSFDFTNLQVSLQAIQRNTWEINPEFELRLVPLDNPDAEKDVSINSVRLAGQLFDFAINTEGTEIIVVLQKHLVEEQRKPAMRKYMIHHYTITPDRQLKPRKAAIEFDVVDDTRPFVDSSRSEDIYWNHSGLMKIGHSTYAFADFTGQIWTFSSSSNTFRVNKITSNISQFTDFRDFRLIVINERLFLSMNQPLSLDPENPLAQYQRMFIAEVKQPLLHEWEFGMPINIPGEVIEIVEDSGQLVGFLTSEERYLDQQHTVSEPTVYLTWLNKSNLRQVAELTSHMNSNRNLSIQRVDSKQPLWAFIDRVWNSNYREQEDLRLGFLKVDPATRQLHRHMHVVRPAVKGYGHRLIGIKRADSKSPLATLVIGTDLGLQALRVDTRDLSISGLALHGLNTFSSPDESTPFLMVPSTVWDMKKVMIQGDRIRVVMGPFGVLEGLIREPTHQDQAPVPLR